VGLAPAVALKNIHRNPLTPGVSDESDLPLSNSAICGWSATGCG